MLKIKKTAVTGGLACGKSAVCQIFAQLGAYVVSADKLVHELLSPTTPLGQAVIHLLGGDVLVPEVIVPQDSTCNEIASGKIETAPGRLRFDRALIAKKVFNNSSLLFSLEKLVHPAVQDEIEKLYRCVCAASSTSLFVAEIPLLFEAGLVDFYDVTVVVAADPRTCCRRFCAATGYEAAEFDRRMHRQMPLQEKAALADFVLYNDGDYADLEKATRELYQKILNV